jgi:hypothetical protein
LEVRCTWYEKRSARGGYGQFLRCGNAFPDYPGNITTQESQDIIRQILGALCIGGLAEIIREDKTPEEEKGYQIPASALI